MKTFHCIWVASLGLLVAQARAFWPGDSFGSSLPRHFPPQAHRNLFDLHKQANQRSQQPAYVHHPSLGTKGLERMQHPAHHMPSRPFHGHAPDGPPPLAQQGMNVAASSPKMTEQVQYFLQIPQGIAGQGLKFAVDGYDAAGGSIIRLYTGKPASQTTSDQHFAKAMPCTDPQTTLHRDIFGHVVRHQPQPFSQSYSLPRCVDPASLHLQLHGPTQVKLIGSTVTPSPQLHRTPTVHTQPPLETEQLGQSGASAKALSKPQPSPAQDAMQRLGVQLPADVQLRAVHESASLDWAVLEEEAGEIEPQAGQPADGAFDGYEYRGEWHEY